MLLKRWKSTDPVDLLKLLSILVCVQASNIPTKLWDDSIFEKIGLFLGKPIYFDDITRSGSWLEFAHIFVVMDVDSYFPKMINLSNEEGEIIEIKIKYDGDHPFVSHAISLFIYKVHALNL